MTTAKIEEAEENELCLRHLISSRVATTTTMATANNENDDDRR